MQEDYRRLACTFENVSFPIYHHMMLTLGTVHKIHQLQMNVRSTNHHTVCR
jgi:hypothetical protein